MTTEPGEMLASFAKSAHKEVRASIDLLDGKPYLNLRVFFRQGTEWRASRQGLVITIDRFPDLEKLVAEVGENLQVRAESRRAAGGE